MILHNQFRRISIALAVASCLLIGPAPNVTGESPIARFVGPTGAGMPINFFGDAPYVYHFIVMIFDANPAEFLRWDPDGTVWWHLEANKAVTELYYNPNGNWPPLESDPVELEYTGYGSVEAGLTVFFYPDGGFIADGDVFGWKMKARLANEAGEEFPFYLHMVLRDWKVVLDDERFAPLGLGK